MTSATTVLWPDKCGDHGAGRGIGAAIARRLAAMGAVAVPVGTRRLDSDCAVLPALAESHVVE
jgi:NAD(P)-dependent dehydrogenase (short-subunit alcohol dehydrogenase family)